MAHVEKDFWVTEVLRGVARCSADTGVSAVFKGGTSLSKAFGLIQRFSEDVDVIIIAPGQSTGQDDRCLKSFVAAAEASTGLTLKTSALYSTAVQAPRRGEGAPEAAADPIAVTPLAIEGPADPDIDDIDHTHELGCRSPQEQAPTCAGPGERGCQLLLALTTRCEVLSKFHRGDHGAHSHRYGLACIGRGLCERARIGYALRPPQARRHRRDLAGRSPSTSSSHGPSF